MPQLNYKHLRYFWMVGKSGSIARASEQLHLTPQSISGQLSEFETTLGVELFRRVGRGLELTEIGQRMLTYAEQIFSIGDEMLDVVRNRSLHNSVPFSVGIADSVPKMIAYRLVEPALGMDDPIRLICREGRLAALLADLAVHRLDMVIADRPMPGNLNVRGYDHLLGESGVTVFAAKSCVRDAGSDAGSDAAGDFPANLDGAPFLLPGEDVALRVRLLRWLDERQLRPKIVGEFDDSALLMAFGQAGAGLFVAPTAIESYVCQQHQVEIIGRIDAVREQIYAITTERRLTHPVIVTIYQAGQDKVFGGGAPVA